MKTDAELIDAYQSATNDYEAAKDGRGDRLEAFTRLLVAERVLAARLPWQHLVRHELRPKFCPPLQSGGSTGRSRCG